MLRDRDRIAARRVHDEDAGSGGGGQIDVVDADARASDYLELRSLRKYVRIHLHGAAYDQSFRCRKVLSVVLRIGDDNFPARLRFQ